MRNREWSREISSRWARSSGVATKIVSSPEIVPTTSGHSAVSMASATLWAEPVLVRMTVILAPAGRIARTKAAREANSSLRGALLAAGGR
jgi:hypothetical protein